MARIVTFFRLLNQPCRDMTHLVSKSMDARLPFSERVAVGLHMLYCRACRRYKSHLEAVRAAVRLAADKSGDPDPAGAPALSAEARERMRDALRGG